MESIIVEKLKQLPPEYHKDVIHFIDALLTEKVPKRKKKLKLDWIGGLVEYRDQYTALELQKKTMEWRD
ncbi:MAG: DUF2281 domain-containing protein [Candidatus Poribacteria bacterium]|nr:DUF2281 domain-containing protein [Candidatus Poribacteria bacterium]